MFSSWHGTHYIPSCWVALLITAVQECTYTDNMPWQSICHCKPPALVDSTRESSMETGDQHSLQAQQGTILTVVASTVWSAVLELAMDAHVCLNAGYVVQLNLSYLSLTTKPT